MSKVPSEADVRAARATIKWFHDYPDVLWVDLPPEIAMQHTDKMNDGRRVIQAYEEHYGMKPTI